MSGTGRSGSLSLANFLNFQENIFMIHEGKIDEKKIRNLIHWHNNETELFKWLDDLFIYSADNIYYGDTGMYFLPYVESIISKYPNVKIIGLKRDREEVVNSFMKKTQGKKIIGIYMMVILGSLIKTGTLVSPNLMNLIK